MGFSSCMSKCIIITINLIFWAGAALMIFAGAAYLSSHDGVTDDIDRTPAYVTISIGAILFLCGLLGMCGACSENKVLLGFFAGLIFLCLVMLVYSSASLFVNRDSAMNAVDKYVLKQFNNYGNTSASASFTFYDDTNAPEDSVVLSTGSGGSSTTASTTNATSTAVITTTPLTTAPVTTTQSTTPATSPDATSIDAIQSNLQCCGWTNYSDWNNYTYWVKSMGGQGYVPISCCNSSAANNMSCDDLGERLSMKNHLDLIYKQACEKEVHTVVRYFYGFLSWTAVAFAIFVFLGFCGAIYLIRRRRNSDGFNYSSIVA